MSNLDFEKLEEKKEDSWKISDLLGADWVFRKLQKIDKDLEQQIEYAQKEIEKYKVYIERQKKQAENSKDYFQYKLSEYLNNELEKDPNFKLKTAQGSASFRKSKNWNYGNEKALLEDLKNKELSSFIRIKEEINKTELKKHLKILDNGEVVTKDGEVLSEIKVIDDTKLILKY